MGVRKLSVALDEQVLEGARASAALEGSSLSAWLSEAARTRLRVRDGLRGVAEFEAEFGSLPDDAKRRADAILDRAGVGLKPRPRRRR